MTDQTDNRTFLATVFASCLSSLGILIFILFDIVFIGVPLWFVFTMLTQ